MTLGQIRLNTFDGRPVYRFGGCGGQSIVYADTGEEQLDVPMDMVHRAAAAWTGQRVEHGDGRRDDRRRSVDGADAAARSAAALQVLVPRRRAGLHLGEHRRGRAVHDDGLALGRVCRRDSALALLHAAAEARRRVEQGRHLVVGHRHRRRDPRHRRRRVDVFAVEEVPQRRRADEHSVPRSEALAHDLRTGIRSRRGDVGVQRHAVDGSVSAADESRDEWRRADRERRHGRSGQHSGGAARRDVARARSRASIRRTRSRSLPVCR